MIRIRAKRKSGFRRAGLFHPAEPVDYPDDRFSEAELAALQAEPMLRVEVLDEESVSGEPEPGDDEKELSLLLAAEQAIADGNITADGKPTVDAMTERLGHAVSAADRDRAYAAWQQKEATD